MALPKYRVATAPEGAQIRQYACGATTVIGDLVSLVADGDVEPASATDGTDIVGIALEAGSAGGNVLVQEILPGMVISAEVISGSYAAANIGVAYPATNDGVILTAASNNAAILVGLDTTDDDSTGTRRVLVRFDPADLAAPGGSATA